MSDDNPAIEPGSTTEIEQQPSANIIDTLSSPPPEVIQQWPDNWRQQMVGDSDKDLAIAQRFKSPQDMWKSYREKEKYISSNKPSPKRPTADSTDDDVRIYREHMGIPSEAGDYDLGDISSEFGDDIKGQLEGYLKFAHDNHTSPEMVKSTVDWYLNDIENEQQRISDLNDKARIDSMSSLKAEWGGEYEGNINAVQSLFSEAPEGVMESLLEATDYDGLKFAHSADNIRWLVGLAKQINPTATLVPPGPDQNTSIDAEIEKINGLISSRTKSERDKYYKDEALQERYLKLLDHKARQA